MVGRPQPFQKYFGKDYVSWGSSLILDTDIAWKKISRRARRCVDRAREAQPRIVKVQGTEDDINLFRPIWYNPHDPELPVSLSKEQHMWFAYVGDELVAGTIVTPVDRHLFLHFNGASEKGRELQIPSLMIWNVVEFFHKSQYTHLDVGCSYRPALQDFFKNWATSEYPIIFRPAAIVPKIDITPFESSVWWNTEGKSEDARVFLAERFSGRPLTIVPRAVYALSIALRLSTLTTNDEVWITTTTDSLYVSGCVTSTVETVCGWSREQSEKTKAIILIHEFGRLHPRRQEIRTWATQKGIPLIEDCAYAWHSGDAGTYGDYVIYSFPKFFPVQCGGLLVGAAIDDRSLWNQYGCLDVGKREQVLRDISPLLPHTNTFATRRVQNADLYVSLMESENLEPYFSFVDGEVPGAYLMKTTRGKELSDRLQEFGIECGVYHHHDAIFLPVHQGLSTRHIEYIVGVIRSMFRVDNGIKDYVGHAHAPLK